MSKKTFAALRAGAAPLVLGLMLAAAPAWAQDAAVQGAEEEAEEAIVVTGSRIARTDLEAASPVSVITADQFALKNAPGVEEFLRDLPQAVPGVGANNNNGNDGVATVNLRNLGEERTLVLVDGRRFVPYDSQGLVDLNMIPAALVQRVEVLTGGASTVYGSDAVAGVVNFILKKNFTGIEADAQIGVSSKNDGEHHDFSLTGGMNIGDRGNIVVNGTYSKQDLVTQGARKFSNESLAAADLSASGGSSTNLFGSIDTPGGRYTFTPTGFQPYSAARDSFNFNPYNLLQVPARKVDGDRAGALRVDRHVSNSSRAAQSAIPRCAPKSRPRAPSASASTSTTGPTRSSIPRTILSAAGARTILGGLRHRQRRHRPRRRASPHRPKSDRGYPPITAAHGRRSAGFRGDIGSSMKWEVFAQYGKSKREIAYLNDLDANKVQQALLVTGTAASPACTVTTRRLRPGQPVRPGQSQRCRSQVHRLRPGRDRRERPVRGGWTH